MANKTDFIQRVQAHAQLTFEIVQKWKDLITEYKMAGYHGLDAEGNVIEGAGLTEEDLDQARRGDDFDLETFRKLMVGAEQLADLMDSAGHLAAMVKVKA